MTDDDPEPTEIAGFELPDAPEDATERNGVLSSQTEVHALVLGLGAGVIGIATGNPILLAAVVAIALGVEIGRLSGDTDEIPAAGEIRKEPWYALGGVLVGYFIGTLL
jgi:hypothetical protein